MPIKGNFTSFFLVFRLINTYIVYKAAVAL